MHLIAGESKYHAKIHQSDGALPWLFMFHGFMGSQKVFHHLLPELRQWCNPVTIDLAGHGQTTTPASVCNFEASVQTEQMLSILKRLRFDKLYLYGYSMGGRLAFQLMTTHPYLFEGVIIESAHCGIASEHERIQRKKTDQKRVKMILSDYRNFTSRWTDLPLFEQTPDTYKELYKKEAHAQNPESMAASLRGFGAGVMPDVCSKLNKLNIPVHYVAGSLDNKYVSVLTDINSKTKQSTLHVIPDAGHRVHTDRPKELLKIIAASLH